MKIDEVIEKKEKLILEWTDELEMTPDNELIYLNHCKEIIENYKQEIEWLEELKVLRTQKSELEDVVASLDCQLEVVYDNAIDGFVDYLNNQFRFRHDIAEITTIAESLKYGSKMNV